MQLSEAKELALSLVKPGSTEWVLLDQALGRVLAEDVTSPMNLPGESRSRMDGFAMASRDSAAASRHNPVELTLLEEVLAAGHEADQVILSSCRCVRILTGAPIPKGADCVVPWEDAVEDEGRLVLRSPVLPGSGVTPAGSDIRAGERLLDSKCVLSPTRLALLASIGMDRVPVYCRPRVALLATGDELVEPGEVISGRPLAVCNNRALLGWMAQLQGGEPISLGIAGDDLNLIVERLREVNTDFVITTGGTGQGDRDFIGRAWDLLGVRTCFHSLDLSPGRNSALGVRKDQLFVALSGNPWAAQVVFQELVSPMLWRRQGIERNGAPVIPACVNEPIRKRPGVQRVIHGKLELGISPPTFTPMRVDGNSLYSGIRDRLAYCLIDAESSGADRGDFVQVRVHDLPVLTLSLFGHLG